MPLDCRTAREGCTEERTLQGLYPAGEEEGNRSHRLGVRFPAPRTVPIQRTINHKVVTADFVLLENSGIVHIAPGHGWDDYVLGTKEGLPIFCPVDGAGRFKEEAGHLPANTYGIQTKTSLGHWAVTWSPRRPSFTAMATAGAVRPRSYSGPPPSGS